MRSLLTESAPLIVASAVARKRSVACRRPGRWSHPADGRAWSPTAVRRRSSGLAIPRLPSLSGPKAGGAKPAGGRGVCATEGSHGFPHQRETSPNGGTHKRNVWRARDLSYLADRLIPDPGRVPRAPSLTIPATTRATRGPEPAGASDVLSMTSSNSALAATTARRPDGSPSCSDTWPDDRRRYRQPARAAGRPRRDSKNAPAIESGGLSDYKRKDHETRRGAAAVGRTCPAGGAGITAAQGGSRGPQHGRVTDPARSARSCVMVWRTGYFIRRCAGRLPFLSFSNLRRRGVDSGYFRSQRGGRGFESRRQPRG